MFVLEKPFYTLIKYFALSCTISQIKYFLVSLVVLFLSGAYAVVWNNTYDLLNGGRGTRGTVVLIVDRFLSVADSS